MIINIRGEELELFAQRAVYWRREDALIITDTHFGKAATFRSAGIPVPEDTTKADLERITSLLDRTSASTLIILGDLLHAKAGRKSDVMAAFHKWRMAHSEIAIHLLRGNHDRSAGAPPDDWKIQTHPHDLLLPPFRFMHEPPKIDDDLYVMCGHIHPSVSLTDGLHRRVRLPCFSFGERHAILPAFGSFTGTFEINPIAGDRVFVIAEGDIIEVPHARNG